jgi:DNA end-binding protein Ku
VRRLRRADVPGVRVLVRKAFLLRAVRRGGLAVARAIWKGRLVLEDIELAVRMYSAVQDRKVHFRLLDKDSLSPVHQRIVRKSDGKEVPKEDRRKAYPLDEQRAVILAPEELEALEPEPSREIRLCRFVPPSLVSDQWYDRPYYLGPDEDERRYFALAAAMASRNVVGIARWAMRKKRYVGALGVADGYLMMSTLRRADQVLSLPRIQPAQKPDRKELKLAEQLVETVSGDFEPGQWQDEYRERLWRLIEAKARGKKVELHAPKRRRPAGGLAVQLRKSLESMKGRKVA